MRWGDTSQSLSRQFESLQFLLSLAAVDSRRGCVWTLGGISPGGGDSQVRRFVRQACGAPPAVPYNCQAGGKERVTSASC